MCGNGDQICVARKVPGGEYWYRRSLLPGMPIKVCYLNNHHFLSSSEFQNFDESHLEEAGY